MTAVRRNILADVRARDQFIRGVKLLKQERPSAGGPATYDLFVIWHHQTMMRMTPPAQSRRNAAHSGPIFLPWHRHMLILFERNLQRVLGDPAFGLPYWDWAADGDRAPAQQRGSPLWAADCLGGDGDPVSTGPFAAAQWQVNVETSPSSQLRAVRRGLRRAFGRDTPGLPRSAEATAALGIAAYDAAPWLDTSLGSFRNTLEGWRPDPPRMHNLVHVWIGGDMGASTSPNDPAFYLNHANVDRLWASWQARHPGAPYLPRQQDRGAPVGHRDADRMMSIEPAPPTPRDLLDVSRIYSYDTLA